MAAATDPTPAQIAQVQANLKNMQAFNDQVYSFGLSKYMNAYALLSEQDNNDLGLTIGLNVVEGAFWAAGSLEGGPVGNFLASFLSGMVAYWLTNTPPSLNGAFAQNVIRFQVTTEAVDTQLATYYSDVAGNWNTSYTYNGQTGTLSDLATLNFPAETDPAWTPMLDAALKGVDQALWTALLKSYCVVTFWFVSGTGSDGNGASLFTEDQDQSSPPVQWAQGYYKQNPAYYETWAWYSGDPNNCCGPPACWAVSEYNVGTGVGPLGTSDGSISADACNYLFIDSTPDVVINQNGLFTREDVFTKLGITQKTYYSPNYVGQAPARLDNVSTSFLRALKQQQTLGQLVWREGRQEIQKRLVHEAQRDPVFAHNLLMRPRMTIEQFLGVKIPEVIAVNAVQEVPWSFELVLPVRSWSELSAFSTDASAGDTSAPAPPTAGVKQRVEQFFERAPVAPGAGGTANFSAVYQVLLSGPEGGDWVLRVQNGKVTSEKGRVNGPDVTLQASASDWNDIASGKLDALLAFFTGKLSVDGDLMLARRLRDIFPPGTTKL